MATPSQLRAGSVKTIVIAVACLATMLAAGVYFVRQLGKEDVNQTILLHTVERTDFEAFVTEPGDVDSSSNVEVRCKVQSRGGAGTSILKICDEGTHVKAGDFLVQFDDSVLQNELLAQKIVAANDKAVLIQAKSGLNTAERTLREYSKGLFTQEKEVIESEIFVAEENLERAETYAQYSRRLAVRGYINSTQLRADEFAVQKAKKDLTAARRKLKVFTEFTRDKKIGEFEAEIEKQKARVEAATFTLELSKQKLKHIEEQIALCFVTAPSEGQVIYANEQQRHSTPIVIEEGTVIRDNQIVIRLPDLRNMQVKVKINESHVNRIKPGQPSRIILDADPENTLRGEVKEVAPYPYPMRWHGAPLEYGAVVTIIDPPSTIRPGLRAKVQISFESMPNVLQVPLAAVIAHNDHHYCLLRKHNDCHPQMVQVGPNNNNHVIITGGLDTGDEVALTPFRHIERATLSNVEPAFATATPKARPKNQPAAAKKTDKDPGKGPSGTTISGFAPSRSRTGS